MSNLWAALLASDKGAYAFDLGAGTCWVSCLDERRFDRLAGKYPFGLVAMNGTLPCESGVVWTTLKGNRAVEMARKFFMPPTVLFRRGAQGVALWAVQPTVHAWTINEQLARLFKGRLKDASPFDFRLDIRGCSAEWQMNAYYNSKELAGRL